MNPIIEAALRARTKRDVDRLEAAIKGRLGKWEPRYLGDMEANWSAVSSPADAAAVLFERVTNMWDALIELEVRRQSRFALTSPEEAARQLFGITDGVGNLTPDQRDKIARLSHVTLLDSDDSVRRPTISFRDFGIGLSPEEMPTTILSLQGSNKLKKFYLHGIFGKGGSSASVFSDATIIVSRKHPDLLDGEEDRVAVTVVREDDAPDVGLPFYRYIVSPEKFPFWVPASEAPDFEPGTLVVHVNYQAGKMGLQQWTFEESIYAYAETLLFKPTLPYSLQDSRSPAANTRPEGRRKPSSLSGLAQRLERTKTEGLMGSSRWSSLPVPGVGEVKVRWWLFDSSDARRKRAAKGYVVLFTTNGQVHHAWDQTRLQYQVEGLRRVSQRVVVEVDCNGIEVKSRAKVFDSFRAQVRKGPEGKALEEAVADMLANDPDLAEYESAFVRQSLKATSQRVSEGFRKRLNRALKFKVPGLAGGGRRRKKIRPPRPKQEIELYVQPTTFTGPESTTVLRGSRGTIYFEINAVDGFVPDVGSLDLSFESGSPEIAIGIGDLRRGRLQVTLVVPDEAEPGIYRLDAALEWMRASGGLGRLEWTTKTNVVAELPDKQPSRGKGKPKKVDSGDVAFLWSTPEEQESWTSEVAGDLQYLKGSDLAEQLPETYGFLKDYNEDVATIVLNKEFPEWNAYRRAMASKLTDQGIVAREDRYGLAVGVAVANLHEGERKLRKKFEAWEAKPNGSPQPLVAMTPEQLHRAAAEAARGVLALMPDFDELMGDIGEVDKTEG